MISLLDPQDPCSFPDPAHAEREPDGLLAVGGDLSPLRLLTAYRNGIFPWYSRGDPILWWSPDPRTVLYPSQFHLARSLRKRLRRGAGEVRFDHDFAAVIEACSGPRASGPDTWLTPEMRAAYRQLHRLGHAHSIEYWCDGELLGGLYGLAIGQVFFGESMFSRVSDGSKIAFAALIQQLRHWGFQLIDCQVHSLHLQSLGAVSIPRAEFLAQLKRFCPIENGQRWQGLAPIPLETLA